MNIWGIIEISKLGIHKKNIKIDKNDINVLNLNCINLTIKNMEVRYDF